MKIIGIDPDSKKHGVAVYVDGKLTRLGMLSTVDLMAPGPWTGYAMNEWDLRSPRNASIRRFADGAGDFNPLYRDADYARGTKYRSIIAMPCFFYTSNYAEVGLIATAETVDLHGFYAGSILRYFRCMETNFKTRSSVYQWSRRFNRTCNSWAVAFFMVCFAGWNS